MIPNFAAIDFAEAAALALAAAGTMVQLAGRPGSMRKPSGRRA